MADDEGGDWFTDSADAEPEPEPEPVPVPVVAPKKKSISAPAAAPAEAKAAEPDPKKKRPEAEDEFLDPDKLLLCKHWIRPKFLQYRYLYDYRHNYYDDVIDYLDKRNRGLSRDIPRAQTWPERVLRNQSNTRTDFFRKIDEDTKFITKTRLSGTFQNYHSREYFNRRYTSIL